ncbi:efflux RND transporter permease subunit [Wenzhouxiangella marina]|uniref:Acriflavin resistance protein n=1 Tax=Wenzhouxiangella marina TaxID=1579979 RepID=A0A0K0XT19_9GAMM|nr:efflux RND transporter permease subunit [Wenzhouxiangella marina]AKS40833.1 acriflavin resistance protein [Wenzhouxiangella marina]MBB6087707.1 HAE1 family hydrophobic/amphiphilic exporter-1 [Wenzhouxiangella marina]
MKLIRLATRRRVTIAMVTLAVLLFGLVSLSRLDLSLLPDLSYPTLTVRTDFAGAAPAEIESLITRPIEEVVGVVRGVRLVRSISRPGQSDVTLEFLWGTDMDYAALDVRERLETLALPLQADRPLLLRFDPATEPVMRFALARNAEADPAEDGLLPPVAAGDSNTELRLLRRFVDDRLKKDFEGIAGVAAVTVSGGLEDEIQVLLDQYRLAQLDLSAELVAQRLRAENVNLSGGRLEEGDRQFLVRTLNEFQSVEQIDDLIVATREGRPVYLKDVAEVRQGWREREAITRVDGEEMVELAIYREGDTNVVAVARQVDRALARIRDDLPPDLALTRTYDQSVFIRNAISEVVQAAVFGGLLAIAILYLFLRNLRSTVIVGLAIPISVVATFAAMYSSGLTLNIMSLGGIALAIGLLVDNAIVVLENIAARREAGDDWLNAARQGAGEVAGAVVAATLTTIAVFFPLVFVDGVAGQLFRDQALTVTYALLVSLAVALTLIPMLASLGDARRVRGQADDIPPKPQGFFATLRWAIGAGLTIASTLFVRIAGGLIAGLARVLGWVVHPLVRVFNRGYEALARRYPPVLEKALDHRGWTLLAAIGLFAFSLLLIPRLGMELVPSLAQGEFQVEIQLEPGTPLGETDLFMRGLDRFTRQQPGVARADSVAGTGRRLDSNPEEAGEHTGTLNVILDANADEATVTRAIRQYLMAQAGVDFAIRRPELFSFATPLEVEIAGYDLEQLRAVAGRVASRLEASERLSDVRSTVEQGHPEIQIRFDHERAARLGLRADEIADTVVRQVRGEVATRYTWRERRIDVLVRARTEQRDSVERLGQLVVNPGSPRPVTLDAVAELEQVVGPAEIRRIGQQRVAIVSASPGFGDLGAATEEARALLADLSLPSGITLRVAGQSEEMQRAFRSLVVALALAVFLVYLVMASQFESLLHPFVILLSIPLALTGAVLALFVTGSSLSVVVFIGLIMLAGIVVNNAIVLVTRINQLREAGQTRREAIVEAGRARLRPIVMTTLTTTLGLVPLALGLGEGSELRTPMAITVIGGLLLSTLLTLVVIPVVYSLLDRRRTEADLAEGSGA